GIASDQDWRQIYDEVSLDVHYLHQAGPVRISTPGDKWVMNTSAQYDSDRGWFLPVTISGFDKHQHNFDHIEFQYKESMRGDDSWTNLCSYYADSLLMAKASGERKMIPENGNIETHFYGEGTVMEKAYDLRAVLYCRNGNEFLTTASPVISGVKDTRRPQLFGTPEPANGLVSLGDNIVFNFSEDIEHNYLNAITNFEVKGEVNNNSVSETVSVQFAGNGSVESEAQRNFSGKDVTIDLMIRPDETGRDMPLFSHGTNGKRMQLWLTADRKLKAVIDDQTFVSDSTIAQGGFTQVAMSISQTDSTLTFYNGGKEIGHAKLTDVYNGTGQLIFGRTNEGNRTQSTYYSGRMMEARVWYRAMTGGEVGTTYGSRRLTGYEMGLVDYYPMNEGSGDYALDHTQGANAQLIGASWAMPRGWSLRLDNDGMALTQQALNRTSEQDYTMMFWFKTADADGTLVSNGSGEKGAANHFWLGFDAGQLTFRSNGMAVEAGSGYNDDQWHHYAMTVNRANNVANIYVDQTLRATFSPDSLGGISGGTPVIGGCDLTGNVDELCMFQQALPLTLIKAYATKSPQGDEAGLITYLSFDRQERQKDNDIETVAYPWSKKIYLDDMGQVRYELDPATKQATSTPVRDYVFVASIDEILRHITDQTAAPVVPYEELKNLKFGFVGKDNQVLVTLNELASRLNRRNIYVTLRDVEDKNG
ncbi:MAG: LamG-like jellyroll fold domain-containing protein, partial [Prevotella sp.]